MTRPVVAIALEVVECCHEETTYKGSSGKLTLSQIFFLFVYFRSQTLWLHVVLSCVTAQHIHEIPAALCKQTFRPLVFASLVTVGNYYT